MGYDRTVEHSAGIAMAHAMFAYTFGIVGDGEGGKEGEGLGTGVGVLWRGTHLIVTLGDHFKTGHRGSLQNRPTDHHPGRLVLPYRLAVWQVQFGPVRSVIVKDLVEAVCSANPAILQDHIPVFPFLHRKVSFEN